MISVRHVVPSSTGIYVILAALEHNVEIWNVATTQRIAAFRTIFDFGGRRLALSDQAGILVAAAYIRYGIAGYAMTTGEVLWQRRDIKASQVLSLSPDGSVAYCGLECGPCAVLDVKTGETRQRLRGVKAVADSPFEPVSLHETTDLPELVGGSEPLYVKLAREQPGDKLHPTLILDTAFAPGKVFTTQMGGSLRCFTTLDLPYLRAGELWRYDRFKHGWGVCGVAYRPADDCLVGVAYAVADTTAQHKLLTLDVHSGKVLRSLFVSATWRFDFCLAGRVLVGSDRSVISTLDGSLVAKLE
jgi:hypothetical protein